MSIEVVAALSRIIFESDDKSYTVGEFIDTKSAKRFRASGRLPIGKGEIQQNYRLFGDWNTHQKYGTTFAVVYCEPVRPDSLGGIIPFLANNVKGVGEVTAKKLLNYLEVKNIDELLAICKDTPQKIFDFFRSRREAAQGVIAVCTGNEVYRGIMMFLHEHNIPPNFAQKIFDRYGASAVQTLTENPYRLISDFRNVGFVRADAIAQKLGIELTSIFRMEAAFVYALESAAEHGHCCLPRDVLVSHCCEILGGKTDLRFHFEFVLSQLREVFKRSRDNNDYLFKVRSVPVKDPSGSGFGEKKETYFYLPDVFGLENRVARYCLELIGIESIGAEKAETMALASPQVLRARLADIPWDRLSPEQEDAVMASVTSRMMVLTGGPGCGKTFVLRAVHSVQKLLNRKVALCAPTGLAAKRMAASIGAPASTIHKLLGLGRSDADMVETGDVSSLDGVEVVIVDEASMLSLDLFHALLEALGPNRRLILTGDVDQLPSVSAGNCLRDIIQSDMVKVVRLTKIFRQSSESPIPLVARQILLGEKPHVLYRNSATDFEGPEPLAFVPCAASEYERFLSEFVTHTVPKVYGLSPTRNMQVLVPMRKSEVGQEKSNRILQGVLNPAESSKQEFVLPGGLVMREGDKVIQTKNNYEKDVFNGDLGFCKKIRKKGGAVSVDVEFDERLVTLDDDEVEDLQLCYAMTVHKSQGSEFPLCLVPMFGAYYVMLDRNLLYTAVTRASKFVVFVGEERALRLAVKNAQGVKRFTNLETLLRLRGRDDVMQNLS
jgi:exodeoxyribonuclease V alpha subunit